ncbi:MAG: SGNH/GDSL hydrolase family protein [Candidatus Tectomicrobia bacterium]|nr:SGNH/GDSL hydrolase family protein [Candidatus Tectomicrobia bacterium]
MAISLGMDLLRFGSVGFGKEQWVLLGVGIMLLVGAKRVCRLPLVWRMEPVLLRVGLSCVAVFVALGCCELALQLLNIPPDTFSPWIASETTGYRMAPHLSQRMIRSEYNVLVETNRRGLRDDDLQAKQGTRILLLGDSFAFGYGCERGDTFAALLETRLGVEIINAAVGGYEIIHQVRWYQQEAADYGADLVVYALYLGNDLSRNHQWKSAEDGRLISLQSNFPLRPKRHLKLQLMIDNLRYRLKLREGDVKEWTPYPDYLDMCRQEGGKFQREQYASVESLLGDLNRHVQNHGAKLFVIVIPYKTMVDPQAQARFKAQIESFDATYDLHRSAREIERILEKHQIPFTNLIEPLKKYYDDPRVQPLYFFSDGHFNAAGHEFVTDQLLPILQELIQKMKAEE